MGFETCRLTSIRCPNNNFYCPNSKISKKNFYFVAFRFFENQENSVFGTQLVPTISELNSTGSTYYTIQLQCNSLICAFFRFKKSRNLKNRDLWGDQNIANLTLKTGLLTVFFFEKRYRSINIDCIKSKTRKFIPLRVCSKP